MSRTVSNSLLVGSMVIVAFLAVIACRKEIEKTAKYNQEHYGPVVNSVELEPLPPSGLEWSTPDKILAATEKHKPQTKE